MLVGGVFGELGRPGRGGGGREMAAQGSLLVLAGAGGYDVAASGTGLGMRRVPRQQSKLSREASLGHRPKRQAVQHCRRPQASRHHRSQA